MKNFWRPKIPKTTAFNNPAKLLMTGKRIDLAGIQSFRLGRHEKIYFECTVISDGIASVSTRTEAEWWKRKAERRMRCYSVLIGEARGLEVLGRISDAVMTLDDLKQDQDVLETIFSIGGDDHAADERNL
jgi:hypothetical protein